MVSIFRHDLTVLGKQGLFIKDHYTNHALSVPENYKQECIDTIVLLEGFSSFPLKHIRWLLSEITTNEDRKNKVT
jgi:hypothetical protein